MGGGYGGVGVGGWTVGDSSELKVVLSEEPQENRVIGRTTARK